jgi:dihydrodipicolinate synthase/N-acetylneuraminate lyase
MMVGAVAGVNVFLGRAPTDTRSARIHPLPLLVDTVVPFSAEGQVDLGAVRAHTLWLLGHGVDGFAPGASDFLAVDRREKERILEVVADAAPGRPLFPVIWDPSPAWSVRFARQAQELGATAVLLPPPLLFPVREDAVIAWYRALALAVPLPLVAWLHPRFGNAFGPQLCTRLLAETTVAGWLDATGDVHRLRRLATAHPFRAWVAIDEGLSAHDLADLASTPMLAGGVSRVANAWPELVRKAWNEGAPSLLEAVVHRAAVLQRAGGADALRHLLGLRGRFATEGVDSHELVHLPAAGFR